MKKNFLTHNVITLTPRQPKLLKMDYKQAAKKYRPKIVFLIVLVLLLVLLLLLDKTPRIDFNEKASIVLLVIISIVYMRWREGLRSYAYTLAHVWRKDLPFFCQDMNTAFVDLYSIL